jgi:D-3-phosphoglycerate dehydrogenase
MQKKVVRFNFWLNPAFDSHMATLKDVAFKICRHEDSDEANLRELSTAHVYHICAARDEVPKQFWVNDDLLSKMPNLLAASSSGAGYDPIDVEACNRHGVLVVSQSGCNSDSVAEHTMGLLLSVRHRIAESDRVMRANAYTTREDLMGNEIRGLTMGLVGMGNIGRRVAKLAKAFGMEVLAVDPYLSAEEIHRRGAEPVSFDDLLSQSDVVSLHCPRTPETVDLFGAAEFDKMKKGAVFISTARGGIHDESALHQALVKGHLFGAGLDVWAVEPPAPDHPLLKLPNVVGTYHTAGVTHEARRNAAIMAAEQIETLLRGEKGPRIVNPEAWPVFVERYTKMFGAPAVQS